MSDLHETIEALRAAVRWHVRFAQEAKGLTLADSLLALASLASLIGPGSQAAARTLEQSRELTA